MAKITHFSNEDGKVSVRGVAGNGKTFSVTAATVEQAFSDALDAVASFDSEASTLHHIRKVQENLNKFAATLLERGEKHDASKLGPEEKPGFDRETQLLKELELNTPAYKESLERLKTTLSHHYKNNSHHPEFYAEHGVGDMSLVDIVEMVCDWQAAAERGKLGICDLESQFVRFKFDPQLSNIFRQTWKLFGWKTKRELEESNS